ncbi:ABC transporter permease [Thalassotalea sp. 1_MG-2023]|uniref:ABC transporter permease n=1 Tax=Thalassotalea sp. 1_MG-2023 TaxID=3062680 RepID=UPI0026E3FB43|nr:ABC transporter permease [Thalassotalea sp. 1_MG-2023]MDO6426327.1 ABC transporter permease [Thalassotalea sp. 1_MG-2023]
MIQFKALLIKELKEAFRDKRALMVALSMGLLMPVFIMVFSKFAINEAVDNPPIYVKITGAEYAPKLMKSFTDNNILPFAEVPEDKKRQWDEYNVELIIPDNFANNLREGHPIDLTLRADYSEKSLNAPIRRIKDEVRQHSLSIGYKRLLVRGIDVKLLRPINLQEQDTSAPTSNAVIITLMLGLYLMMGAFVSGQSISVDSSAGERERNVLELLLCQPVKTYKIVLAKLICSSLIATISVTLMLSLTTVSVSFVDLAKIGATFSLDVSTFIALLMLLIPLCFLASSLQLFFAFQAKSFKEAQSTVAMLIMVPAMVPLAMMMMDNKPAWVEWAPISAQSILMEDLFKGLPVDWSALLVSTAATLALTAALVVGMSKRLKSEKVIMSLS